MSQPSTITTEFILGGQKSGKSRRAELIARDWLARSPAHRAVLVATAQPWDEEMRQRIARHQRDRAERVPASPPWKNRATWLAHCASSAVPTRWWWSTA